MLLFPESDNDMWLQTRTGQAFKLDGTFQPEAVKLDDIAHALAMTCRYGGHCKLFYSVAEHSVHVMRRVRELARLTGIGPNSPEMRDLSLAALFHDAAEAYIGDIPTPLKRWLGPEIKLLEAETMRVIGLKLGLRGLDHPYIKQADLECLSAESQQLFDPPPLPGWGDAMPEPWWGCQVNGWGPVVGRQRFLWAAENLGVYAD